MGALLGAGKRLITGESLFMTVFTNGGAGKQQVAFAAPYPGKILAMDLKQLGGELVCQKDSFLCAARGVSIGIAFQRKIGVGLFGGEGFIMQRLHRRRLVLRARRRNRASGRARRRRDAEGRYGMPGGPAAIGRYDIEYVGKIKTALFGGEGLFFATPHRSGPACGCSRCRSAGWPIASTRRRPRPAAAAAKAGRFWAVSAICWTAIHNDVR